MSCRKCKRISCHVLLGVVLSKRLAMPSQRVIHCYILNCNMILVLSSVVCVCVWMETIFSPVATVVLLLLTDRIIECRSRRWSRNSCKAARSFNSPFQLLLVGKVCWVSMPLILPHVKGFFLEGGVVAFLNCDSKATLVSWPLLQSVVIIWTASHLVVCCRGNKGWILFFWLVGVWAL